MPAPAPASSLGAVKVLFIGDVVGRPGRDGFAAAMPRLRARLEPDLVIVNGENSAGGIGITRATAEDLFDAGADVITNGNHTYRHREVYAYLDDHDRVIRPANFRTSNPGRGHCVVEARGVRVGVLNLIGDVGLDAARPPFLEADSRLDRLEREGAEAVIVDFHAEVTSEKVAMGWYLDGRVGAVLGTHTHVPTADGRILPGGTAFISDVGMTAARTSVLGVKPDGPIERFRTGMPVRFETADEDVWINGALVELGADGLAVRFEQVLEPAAG
ncbi:TIGR00282 family metallophosphoesterase [Thermoleophilia bacterium SCSIO 60948]|nr:TIGR00282 family metallophosphoesterase [Thermoleophilia bacterium SCSIO 60948]